MFAACLVAAVLVLLSLSKGAGLLLVLSYFKPGGRSEVIREERQRRSDGFDSLPQLQHLIGAGGELTAPARPVGKARFGEEIVAVVSEAGYLDRGTQVQGVAVRGGQLVVRESAPTPN